jgi:sRNA-binding carbon storage regulator CsrA
MTRGTSEGVVIGEEIDRIHVVVLEIRGDEVRLGISGPGEGTYREETLILREHGAVARVDVESPAIMG